MTVTNPHPTALEVITNTILADDEGEMTASEAAASVISNLATMGYRIVQEDPACAVVIALSEADAEWPVAFAGLIERDYLVGIIGYDGAYIEEHAILTGIDRDPADGFEVLCWDVRDADLHMDKVGEGRARIEHVAKVVIY